MGKTYDQTFHKRDIPRQCSDRQLGQGNSNKSMWDTILNSDYCNNGNFCTADGVEICKIILDGNLVISFKGVSIFLPILNNIAGNKGFQKSTPNPHSMNTRIYARVTFRYIQIKILTEFSLDLEKLDFNFIKSKYQFIAKIFMK